MGARCRWVPFDYRVVRSGAVTAFWVLSDQGLFALSNFVINVLFARWLAPVDYGWFVLSFSLSQFVGMLHFGAVQEPLLVQSARVPWSQRRAYTVSLLYAHLILLAIAATLGAIGWAIARAAGEPNLGWTIACGLIGAIAILTNVIGRRLCFIFRSVRTSSIVGALYLLGSVLSGLLMHRLTTVWWVDIWLIIGGWSLLGSAVTFWLAYTGASGPQSYPLSEIISVGRRYAHWGVAASVCGWLRSDGLFIMLARFAGLEAVAETRAIFNLGSPVLQANMAVHVFALVGFSADSRRGSKENIWRIVGLYFLGMLILLPIVQYFSPYLVDLFYHGRYLDGAWQLPLYCLALGLGILDTIISSVFKAQGIMRDGYISIFITGAVSVVLGFVLIPLQHTLIYVLLLSSGIGLAAALLLRMRALT
jgi:O-antigen/teichoic acid export membrane protein